MKNLIADLSQRKASIIVGVAFLIMFPLAIFFNFYVIESLIVSGDAAATANNIKADELQFGLGIASYLIVLALDVVVALALYVILKPVNKNHALLATVLRLVYTAIMGISLFALVLLFINEYSNGQLIAYIFFISHLFILGLLVFKSGYIPRSLGIFLIIASFCYIITLYGDFILHKELYEILFMIAIVPATFAELSLGIWLLFKGGKISKMKKEDKTPT